MRLLYVSLLDYRFSPRQRPQYLVELLSQWHKIDYVNLTDWYALLQILLKKRKFTKVKKYPNLYIHNILRLPFNRVRLISVTNDLIKKYFIRLLLQRNKYDYIIITNPLDYQLLPQNVNSKIIYDCADKMDTFLKDTNMKIILNRAEESLVKNATFVTCVSEALKTYLNKYRSDIFVINNGVNLDLYKNILLENEHNKNRSLPYKLGFIGAIGGWVDIDFIKDIAKKLPDIQFYFVGPLISCHREDLENGVNIFYLGVKPHEELPQLINSFDICLLPFKISDISKYSNPVKLYEYLALGKPVLARYWPELNNEFKDLIYYYNNDLEFIELVQKITKSEPSELIKKRQEFAFQHSWTVQVEHFNRLLEEFQ